MDIRRRNERLQGDEFEAIETIKSSESSSRVTVNSRLPLILEVPLKINRRLVN